MTSYHDQFIGVYENAISDEWCDYTIEVMEENSKIHQQRKDYWGDNPLQAKDASVDLSAIFQANDDRAKFIKEEFDKSFKTVYEIYKERYTVEVPTFRIDHYKLQKTTPTGGYHSWHCEFPPELPSDLNEDQHFSLYTRYAVYTVYLNDIKEGGETEFLYQSKRIPPKKGSICIFPSSYTHLHRGNPPLSDTKYIMTGWLHINKE